MIHAYDKLYLERARTSLARMLDFAVYDLGQDITSFFDLFVTSGVSDDFESGDIRTLVGCSGVELAYEVLDRCGIAYQRIQPRYTENRSEEYWLGWALAYYQWETALSFEEIIRAVPITEIQVLYTPYHEMDIRQYVDKMNEMLALTRTESNLKQWRKRAGLSQSQLARNTEIPLRTIQQYEQRQKNINKAQADYIVRLASVLSCQEKDLLE